MRQPRSARIPYGRGGCYHLLSRCSRRAFHLNTDERKYWIEERLLSWAKTLCIDLMAYAILDSHFHIVIRCRPDVASRLTDEQVVRRYLSMTNLVDWKPTPLNAYKPRHCKDKLDLVDQARLKIAHPTAMMRALKEGSARLINLQDKAAGHVWESRYHDVSLLDAGAVIACMLYVDLNPLRAGICKSPEKARFCSAGMRTGDDVHVLWRMNDHPILDETGLSTGSLRVTPDVYMSLLNATARGILGIVAKVPTWAEDWLIRMGIKKEEWISTMSQPGKMTGTAIGTVESRARISAKRLMSDKSGLFGTDKSVCPH